MLSAGFVYVYGCFHSTGQQLLGMYIGTIESFFFLIHKKVQLLQDWLGTPRWRI